MRRSEQDAWVAQMSELLSSVRLRLQRSGGTYDLPPTLRHPGDRTPVARVDGSERPLPASGSEHATCGSLAPR
jgi:hypothetical protein